MTKNNNRAKNMTGASEPAAGKEVGNRRILVILTVTGSVVSILGFLGFGSFSAIWSWVTGTSLGTGDVAGQVNEDPKRPWNDLRATLEDLWGNELLGLDGIDYSRSNWVVANAASDSRSFDWLFLEGSGRDFVREYVSVRNGSVEQKHVPSDVRTTRWREQKGSGIFNFLVKDIWWTNYTETVGNYKIRRDVADRRDYRADGSGLKPSDYFLQHAVDVIQRHVTSACERRLADEELVTGALREVLSDHEMNVSSLGEAVAAVWPLPSDVCEPDNGSKLAEIFEEALDPRH